MSKTFFDKNQAVAVLIQIEARREIDVFEVVDKSHKYFKLSSKELEERLNKYLDSDGFAGVVDMAEN